ncbi:SpoIIE family protein phosphatase [Vicingaceae bacterium]|nr:SpoIIE family protein phosphatase [Vicingaceae bacterium]
MKLIKHIVLLSILLISFQQANAQLVNSLGDTLQTGVPIPAQGKVIHPDSVSAPVSTPLNGQPKIVPTNTNVHKAGTPKVIEAKSYTPNLDSITAILINSTGDTVKTGIPIPTTGKLVQAKPPQVVTTKDAYIASKNPAGFSVFGKLQGLKHGQIWDMLQDSKGNIWYATGGGVSKYDGKSFTHFTEAEGLSNNIVRSILEDKSGNLWFGTYGGVSKYDGKSFTHFTEAEGLSNNLVCSIIEDKSGNLWFGTYGGVSKYDGKSFTHFTEAEGLSNNFVFSMLEDNLGNIWFGTRFGISILKESSVGKLAEKNDKVKLSLPLFKKYGYNDGIYGIGINGGKTMVKAKDGNIWVGTNDRLMKVNPTTDLFGEHEAPKIELNAIELFNEQVVWLNLENKQDSVVTLQNGIDVANFEFDGITKWNNLPENLSLAYNNNSLTFKFIGITMYQPKKVKYQYILEGLDKNWSGITGKAEAPYGNLPHGDYTFKVKAMNSNGNWSEENSYSFTIRPPWWKTNLAYGTYVILFLTVFWSIIRLQTRRLKKRQEELEHEVEVATTKIVEQKKVVESTLAQVEYQKEEIEEAHKEITDSINYAERIQRSFLATQELLDNNLGEHFVFFKPKDVVSGDFYWADQLDNGDFAVVNADSTGHGVPGAIMSILNISSIERAIEQGAETPSQIFNGARTRIIERLKKDGSEQGGKDGMDASIVCFNADKTKMTYTAAQNPIWVIRGGEVIQIKAEKMPVGKHDNDHIPFEGGEFDLLKGDQVYTLTDGFQDQFGGPKGKKFMIKKMREYVLSISHLSMQEQHQKLEEVFSNWKGDVEQVDDVCVIGVRI